MGLQLKTERVYVGSSALPKSPSAQVGTQVRTRTVYTAARGVRKVLTRPLCRFLTSSCSLPLPRRVRARRAGVGL
jgi:hypothetical protein